MIELNVVVDCYLKSFQLVFAVHSTTANGSNSTTAAAAFATAAFATAAFATAADEPGQQRGLSPDPEDAAVVAAAAASTPASGSEAAADRAAGPASTAAG